MKKVLALSLCLCAPMLMANTGCSSGTNSVPIINGQSVSQTAPAISNNAKKALTSAHIAYNAVGTEILSATQSGVLKGATAGKVKVVYDKAGDALATADKAAQLADESNVLAAVGD